jgi:DNA-binding beta-propeller fold protein YncE
MNACPTAPNYVTVYDESGNLIPVSGTFPGIIGFTGGIAFDSLNGLLYLAGNSEAAIRVFDTSGNPIATSGSFPPPAGPNIPSAIAFDPRNREVYAAYANVNAIQVYDENGNLISTSGTFPNLDEPSGIALDTSNHQLYVMNRSNHTITVYDEQGNQLTTSGGFPDLVGSPYDVAFDPLNDRLYAGSEQNVIVYDENGNVIQQSRVSSGGVVQWIAFDTSNQHFYATTGAVAHNGVVIPGGLVEFDQNLSVIGTSGEFPDLVFPSGIAVVP